jgi:hypothetical protein
MAIEQFAETRMARLTKSAPLASPAREIEDCPSQQGRIAGWDEQTGAPVDDCLWIPSDHCCDYWESECHRLHDRQR